MKTYRSLNVTERHKVKSLIDRNIKLREQERDNLHELFIAPLNQNIKLAKQVLRNEVSIDQYIHDSEKLSKRIIQSLATKQPL